MVTKWLCFAVPGCLLGIVLGALMSGKAPTALGLACTATVMLLLLAVMLLAAWWVSRDMH
jgi:uncharacterized membrane protein YfcA